MDTYSKISHTFGSFMMARFANKNSRRILKQVTLDINGQNTLSGLTYDYLAQLLGPSPPPIDRESFIRMWKTIMLKRVQNTSRIVRADISFGDAFPVPAPLRDILRALGQYETSVLGFIIDVVPPEPASDQAHNWFQVDVEIVGRWLNMMKMVAAQYSIFLSPPANQLTGSAIVLTAIYDCGDFRTVRSNTIEVTASEYLLRVVNDELFERPIDEFLDMGIVNTHSFNVNYMASMYVDSYKVNSAP